MVDIFTGGFTLMNGGLLTGVLTMVGVRLNGILFSVSKWGRFFSVV